jgi:hydroxyacylglutathione hydrolase
MSAGTGQKQNAVLEKKLVVGPFQCNCRLFVCPSTGDAVLVDPGDEAPRILKWLDSLRRETGLPIRVKHLFHTHGHLDHVAASRGVREGSPVGAGAGAESAVPQLWIHREDEPLYRALKMQGQMFGLEYDEPLPIDRYFEHEQDLRVGELKFSVIHTPGHSPGSVCLRLHEDTALGVTESLMSGDTLFQGSVGRTDLWGADQDTMFRSIRERILTLDGDTRVCPGHGPDTRVGVEKRENPFLS